LADKEVSGAPGGHIPGECREGAKNQDGSSSKSVPSLASFNEPQGAAFGAVMTSPQMSEGDLRFRAPCISE
jgi:hypothetical protein